VNDTEPSKHFSVSDHHAPCSARSLLACAAAADSKRAMAKPDAVVSHATSAAQKAGSSGTKLGLPAVELAAQS
jgi:hypothetical protein